MTLVFQQASGWADIGPPDVVGAFPKPGAAQLVHSRSTSLLPQWHFRYYCRILLSCGLAFRPIFEQTCACELLGHKFIKWRHRDSDAATHPQIPRFKDVTMSTVHIPAWRVRPLFAVYPLWKVHNLVVGLLRVQSQETHPPGFVPRQALH